MEWESRNLPWLFFMLEWGGTQMRDVSGLFIYVSIPGFLAAYLGSIDQFSVHHIHLLQ